MPTMQHRIEIAVEVDEVFALCRDVERWPTVFPPCKAAGIVEQEGGRQIIEISALAGTQVMSWRSERQIDEATRTIGFRQVRPLPLVKRMSGAWRVYPIGSGTLLVLDHDFEIVDDPRGLVPGISTREGALAYVWKATDDNSVRELGAIRTVLEAASRARKANALHAVFEDEETIAAPIATVYHVLQAAAEWPRLLPHCQSVDVHYDDGYNQEFTMTVSVADGTEKIRSIRYCDGRSSIRYFQPAPPRALSRHSGEWSLEERDGVVRVRSRHEVELSPAGARHVFGDVAASEALATVGSLLSANSRRTLAAVKSRVQADAGN